jgi:hypothetical protein
VALIWLYVISLNVGHTVMTEYRKLRNIMLGVASSGLMSIPNFVTIDQLIEK